MGRPAGHPTVAQAYAVLVSGLGETEPSCAGDDRFISETADPRPLAAICRRCPLLAPCRDVALASTTGPIFGVVGGLVRRGSTPGTLTR